jgi:multidrug efflux pump subunit AcrA (membrane-fusion protein)
MTSNEKKKIFMLGAATGLVIAIVAAGTFVARELHSQAAEHNHPTISSPQPAINSNASQPVVAEAASSLQLSPEEITAAGVQIAEARVQRLKTDIEAFGRVEQPETQLAAISARVGGRIDRLFVQYTGERVRRGQRVAEVYSPEFATAADEYRLAKTNRDRLNQSDDKEAVNAADSLVAASHRKLELWGISEEQITHGDGSGIPHVTLYATANGTVVERKVTQGQYVNAGDNLLTLADLSQVWIKADVYESQLSQIRPSQTVDITSDALANQTIHGRVEFIEPNASPQTRTVPVHVHVANPGMRLVPGMFVRANFISPAARETVVVPRSAVLDTGTHKIVYIAKENGAFESRAIETGTPSEDLFPVTRGLKAGEKVVIAGNFLIDSQTRLSSGMSGLYGGSKEYGGNQPAAQSTAEQGTAPPTTKISFQVEPDPVKGGADNTFHVTLTGSDGNAIPDAQVKVTLVMPAMPAMNMPEMRSAFDLPFMGGMYMGKGKVPSEGSWNVIVEATRNGKLIASYRSRLIAK